MVLAAGYTPGLVRLEVSAFGEKNTQTIITKNFEKCLVVIIFRQITLLFFNVTQYSLKALVDH